MKYKSIFVGLVLAGLVCLALGQSKPAPKAASAEELAQLTTLAQQQFGKTFTLPAGFPTPLIVADFDGDGIEDAVIVANSLDPIPDSFEFKYAVIDPYNSYFGLSDPSVTTAFSSPDPKRNHLLLVICGSGAEGWRAAVPKSKFVIVNLPFDTIDVGRMLIKKGKPPIFVIKARESQVMDSAVFWDAKRKRWKWEPGGMPPG